MSGWAEHSASDASQTVETVEIGFSLEIARRMLPLVRRIIRDLLVSQKRLLSLRQEKRRLEQRRLMLDWPQRRRRYELDEELAEQDHNRLDALAELEVLGVVLFDRRSGRVGFPAVIHNRPAFYIWQPGDQTVRHWRRAGERGLRSIPSNWLTDEVCRSASRPEAHRT